MKIGIYSPQQSHWRIEWGCHEAQMQLHVLLSDNYCLLHKVIARIHIHPNKSESPTVAQLMEKNGAWISIQNILNH